MMNKKEFSTLVKRVFNFNHGIKNPQIMHPTRDWFAGLFMGLIIFGVSSAWSAHVYIEYKNTSVEKTTEVFNDNLYREGQVNLALEYYRDKQNIYKSLVDSETYIETVATSSTVANIDGESIYPEESPESSDINNQDYLVIEEEVSTSTLETVDVIQTESGVEILPEFDIQISE